MIHSVAVLASWPKRDWSCLLLPSYDIGSPVRSDLLAILLRAIVHHLTKNRDQDKSQSSGFLAKDCLNTAMPLIQFVWKLICWHCDKFANFKSLLEGFSAPVFLRDSLLQTAFLRLDIDFLNQLTQLWSYRDGWHPRDVLVMVEAALSSDDIGYFLWIFNTVAASVISEHQTAICNLVYRSKQLEHVDALMKVVNPRLTDVTETLAWFLSSRDEKGFTDFLHIVGRYRGCLSSKIANDVDLSNFYSSFVAGCSRFIQSQSSNSLGLYLDSLKELGIDFRTIEGRKDTEASQLALLSALASPDPVFLRLLLEHEAVVAGMRPFIEEYVLWRNLGLRWDSQYSLPSMRHSTLCCAVVLVCDTEFLKILYQPVASLQQDCKGTQEHEWDVSGIIEHISSLSNLEDARLEYMSALMFFHILIHVRKNGENDESLHSYRLKAAGKLTERHEIWNCMERVLYHDTFFTSCSFPCHKWFTGIWTTEPYKRSKLLPRFLEVPDHYSEHLLTQESWDAWRQEALQIIKK